MCSCEWSLKIRHACQLMLVVALQVMTDVLGYARAFYTATSARGPLSLGKFLGQRGAVLAPCRRAPGTASVS
jgi:hypothetical protein